MAVGNSLAAKPQGKMDFGVYLTQDAAKQQINRLLGGQAGTRFISGIVSAVQVNPVLQECTNGSILSAALQGEALKLSPSPQLGQFYMVPFKKKAKYDRDGQLLSPATTEAQFQLGYKGYIQLAKRSGIYKKLNVLSIKEGELISYNPLEEEIRVSLIEDDTIREETPTIGYYAMFEEANGFRHSIYWSKKKMLCHADKYSQAFSAESLRALEAGEIPDKDKWKYSSFWYKDFDGMAHKTMLRQLISKWGTMSIDMQTAYEKDMAVIHEDGTTEYVDNRNDGATIEPGPEPEALETQKHEAEAAPAEMEPPKNDIESGFFS